MTPAWMADGYQVIRVEPVWESVRIAELDPADASDCVPGEPCGLMLEPGDRILVVGRADGEDAEVYATTDGPTFAVAAPAWFGPVLAPPYNASPSGQWHLRIVAPAEVPGAPERRRWTWVPWTLGALALGGLVIAGAKRA